tara:strand:- start:141 stop:1019 length:879 start_codon:yes stop_codon:yes gene_type:complete
MNEKEKAIFDFFADWCASTRKEYRENQDPKRFKQHITELREKAKKAYLREQERWRSKSFEGYFEAKRDFDQAAYQYFLYGLHFGDRIYEDTKLRLEEFHEKWDSLNTLISNSEAISEVVDQAIEPNKGFDMIYDLLAGAEYTDSEKDFLQFKADLTSLRNEQFEARFGEKAVFEAAGRQYARVVFSKMLRGRGKPKNSRTNNLDIFRAFQITRLVKRINERLAQLGFDSTTTSEVFELLIGQDSLLHTYDRKGEIEWGLTKFFKIKNITVRALLNSISRGKQHLDHDENGYY